MILSISVLYLDLYMLNSYCPLQVNMECTIKDTEDPKTCKTITWFQKLSFRKEAKLSDIPDAKKNEYVAVPLEETKCDIEPPDGGFWVRCN